MKCEAVENLQIERLADKYIMMGKDKIRGEMVEALVEQRHRIQDELPEQITGAATIINEHVLPDAVQL